MEATYPFRTYMTEISMWIMTTDLAPHSQCAAIVMRLGGAARELGRRMTPQEMMHGGALEPGGEVVDQVTYLCAALHRQFSALEEETRLQVVLEYENFRRLPGENISSLLCRYDTVRARAASEGQTVFPVVQCASQILRAVGVSVERFFTLL